MTIPSHSSSIYPGPREIKPSYFIHEGNMANAKLIFIGEVTQVAGVAAFVAGVVLSLHHWPAAVALIGGGAAFYVGKKLRAQ